MNVARPLIACLLVLPCLARAAPAIPGDLTGMWFDASHPGWGLGLVQQNDSMFATLFTYDGIGMPAWLVASRLQATGVNFDPCGTMPLTGTLYRTRWPSFGTGSNPVGGVQVQSVGTITVTVATAPVGTAGCDRNRAVVQYSIDDVQSTMTLTRLSWRSNQERLYGQFEGGLIFSAPPSPCPASPPMPVSGRQLVVYGSADDSNPGSVRLLWGTGIDTMCEIRGPYLQAGQLGSISGSLWCGPFGAPLLNVASADVSNLYISDSGFVGEVMVGVSPQCRYRGTLGGARR